MTFPLQSKPINTLTTPEFVILAMDEIMLSIREYANRLKFSNLETSYYNGYLPGKLDGAYFSYANNIVFNFYDDLEKIRDIWYAYCKEADYLLRDYQNER